METTLHRQLKAFYATDGQNEVALDRYRIDAIDEQGRLVEVQCAGLAAIRDKIRRLLKSHEVLVVKPIIARRILVKRERKRGKVVSRRRSPKQGSTIDLFDELVHFCKVFPHENLTLELAFVEIEEHRLPPLKRRWNRKRYRVEDRVLTEVLDRQQLTSASDLSQLLPSALPDQPFTTEDLAKAIDQPRWVAQKVAYCLRKTGAVEAVGKQRNAIVYEQTRDHRAA